MLNRIFRPNPFTGWHMLALVLTFFGVIIAVNITLAVNASRSWTGLVVKNSYEASQVFNQRLERIEKERALGWTSTLKFDGERLMLSVNQRDGTPLNDASVGAMIGRPTHEGEDVKVIFEFLGPGKYSTGIALNPGRWNVRILIMQEGNSVTKLLRLVVQETS